MRTDGRGVPETVPGISAAHASTSMTSSAAMESPVCSAAAALPPAIARVDRPRASRALGSRSAKAAYSESALAAAHSPAKPPLVMVLIDSTMMSALKKKLSVVCQMTVQRIRRSSTSTSETEKFVAFVNEK